MTAHALPAIPSLAAWPSVRRAHRWHAAMETICARHALPASELTRTCEGTTVVFTTARHVIKLYPPFWQPAAAAESTILGHIEGRLGIPTPEVAATGKLEDWPYAVMTRLQGVLLADVWPGLAESHRRAIARQLGEVLARLHTVPTGVFSEHPLLAERWPARVARPIEECVATHREHGAPEAWLAQLSTFFERLPPLHPRSFTPVLVNSDVHGWHLLVTEHGHEWRIAGWFDFDDAMLGWWESELAAPALFLMAAQPAALAECLRGYGAGQLLTDERLSRRLMAYALLNRYWGLDLILRLADPGQVCATFEDLERALFPAAPI